MIKTTFILETKKQLTHDVYELSYSCADLVKESFNPGSYVMFQLAPGLNRSYSVSAYSKTHFTLIIKRIADGRGSPIICDAEIGTTFSGMLPLGHFLLRPTSKSKCFIGTGTGFAPLYCQLVATSKLADLPTNIAFIFGVRNFSDSFYDGELRSFQTSFSAYSLREYFSRETEFSEEHQQHGYVTDWITAENIKEYEEFYLCGSPAMVKDAREKLETLGVDTTTVFWEQF